MPYDDLPPSRRERVGDILVTVILLLTIACIVYVLAH